jgi:NitT/TauT family transport system ATP-binding protein
MTAAVTQTPRRTGPERPQVAFSDVTLDLGGKTILENISLDVKPGEFLCIIGASGCGKTTALRLAAGLYQPTGGTVTFDGKPMLTPRRDIAIVFQDYGKALLPWRTAAGNVSLALEASGIAASQRATRIEELLKKVGLPNHAAKYPAEMSGGMQQRLQIARNLVTGPRLVFMDEPTAGLDVSVQARLLDLLRTLTSTLHLSVLIVTHDIGVARLLAHRLMVMQGGEVVESGLTDQVLDDPQHPYTQTLVSSVLPV